MPKNDNLILGQLKNLQIDTIVKYFSSLYIDVLPTLWHRLWGIEYIKWGKSEYIVWRELKALMEVKLDKILKQKLN